MQNRRKHSGGFLLFLRFYSAKRIWFVGSNVDLGLACGNRAEGAVVHALSALIWLIHYKNDHPIVGNAVLSVPPAPTGAIGDLSVSFADSSPERGAKNASRGGTSRGRPLHINGIQPHPSQGTPYIQTPN